jgi:hypothetical protein
LEKFEAEKKVEVKEMKEDLSDELLGQVMDRMDDNYSSKDSYYIPHDPPLYSEAKKDDNDLDEDAEPEDIEDEDINLEDDKLFEDDESEDDEDTRF